MLTVVSSGNENSSADKVGLYLSEIGRLQNNAGSILQFMAILFAVCIYFFNALVFPQSSHRLIFGGLLALNGTLMFCTAFLFLRCLTLSAGFSKCAVKPRVGFHLLPLLSEEEIEMTLFRIARAFRRGTYCFFLCFFLTLILVCLLAFGSLENTAS
jgi:hypothetical protein